MPNIFTQKDKERASLQRSTFDLEFQNNLTLRYGALYPCFVKPTTPGDSFEIEPELMFRFMPMVYPVQSKIFCNIHFFKVPNRILWDDWKDFQFNTKDGLIPPYIDQSDSSFFQTGSLADYLGVPNVEDAGIEEFSPWFLAGATADNVVNASLHTLGSPAPNQFMRLYLSEEQVAFASFYNGYHFDNLLSNMFVIPTTVYQDLAGGVRGGYPFKDLLLTSNFSHFALSDHETFSNYYCCQLLPINMMRDGSFMGISNGSSDLFDFGFTKAHVTESHEYHHIWFAVGDSLDDLHLIPSFGTLNFDFHFYESSGESRCTISLLSPGGVDVSSWNGYFSGQRFAFPIVVTENTPDYSSSVLFKQYTTASGNYRYDVLGYDFQVLNLAMPFSRPILPFTNNGGSIPLPISALPFRAYEAIYNSFYRNQQNEPFKVNGVAEYNKWLASRAGGSDTYRYGLHFRCYEPDFLTSALPSPQQGIAPLVGVNARGQFEFEDQNGVHYTMTPEFDSDGETITGISYYDSGLPNGTLQAMMHLISQGISINDFRNVNSLQRWLEKNIRKGYRYKDLIEGRFGTNVRYNELDMPEFIGGFSDIISVNPVFNQTEGASDSPLGSFAGVGSIYGKGRKITCKCDETGYIIGIVSISPVPAYDNILPKHFLYKNCLDYYSPEFSRIGMQPILYSEVSPIIRYREQLADSSLSLNDTFGYQRAWYDLVASVDEVHGDFRRDSLRDFVLYRKFLNSPVLGAEFLDIHQDQLNNVFADIDDNDKIIGAINFKVSKKSVVPRYIIPGLE